jgi:hypothetical protein
MDHIAFAYAGLRSWRSGIDISNHGPLDLFWKIERVRMSSVMLATATPPKTVAFSGCAPS